MGRRAQVLLNDDHGLGEIGKVIEAKRPEVLILDPFVRFHNLEENSSTEMTEVLRRIRQLIDTHGISVILIHHTGKNEAAAARGSSAIMGEYDSAIHISSDRGDATHELEFEFKDLPLP